MEDEVEGPYGEFTKLDAIRQVAAMKSLLERDIEVREKAKELTVMGERVRQLQKKLKQSEQVHTISVILILIILWVDLYICIPKPPLSLSVFFFFF